MVLECALCEKSLKDDEDCIHFQSIGKKKRLICKGCAGFLFRLYESSVLSQARGFDN